MIPLEEQERVAEIKKNYNEKEHIPLIYLFIFKKMLEKFGKGNTLVTSKGLIEITRRTCYQIPNKYNYWILDDMVRYKLIEKINNQKYKLLGNDNFAKLQRLEDYAFW